MAYWTDYLIDGIFKGVEMVKFIAASLGSVLGLAKLRGLVAKCCGM